MYMIENVLQKKQPAKPFTVLRAVFDLVNIVQIVLCMKMFALFMFTLFPSYQLCVIGMANFGMSIKLAGNLYKFFHVSTKLL